MRPAKRTWTRWDWRNNTGAPGLWKPQSHVAIVDGLFTAAEERVTRLDMGDALGIADAAVMDRNVLVMVEPADYWRGCDNVEHDPWYVPALRFQRQSDNNEADMRALCKVRAAHRAIVVTPREAVAIGMIGTTPKAWGYGYRAIYDFIDLVIVDGPIGADAWPIHPEWVHMLRDECAGDVAAFAFTGWGSWKPISEAVPGDERPHAARADVWRGAVDDPNDLPMLALHVGAERAGRTLDEREYLNLPDGL